MASTEVTNETALGDGTPTEPAEQPIPPVLVDPQADDAELPTSVHQASPGPVDDADAEPTDAPKGRGGRTRDRLGKAASGARDKASSAAAEAMGRASNADVKEFAASTTSLIDSARPFFLAGCAAVFAVLGFLESDAGTAQVFAVGAVLCVIGAAFSDEINTYLHRQATKTRGE